MRYCKNCGAELNENAVVCTRCGVLVGEGKRFCPFCGAEPDPLASICVKCGYELKPIRKHNDTVPNTNSNGEYSFGKAISTCFSKYATFSGRARRKEFWYWYLFTCLITLLFFISSLIIEDCTYNLGIGEIFILINGLWGLVTFLPTLAVTVRRLHDVGYSGWAYLIALVPAAGVIILFVLCCFDSEPQSNKYGENPKLNN